uniref:Uncharacterized protein n=1 Tax=Escherichia coli TaxID=562 RepID=A0A7L8K9X8_ECOLX|nr:hypothetical protein [Escherichia coli]
MRKKRKYRKKRNQQGEEGRGTVARLPCAGTISCAVLS